MRRRRASGARWGVGRLADLALAAYDRVIGLRLDEIAIDGSQHKASMGGSGTGPSNVDRGKLGWKWSIATEAAGIPIAWIVVPDNVDDHTLVDDTVGALDARGFEVEIEQAHLDRGYDCQAVWATFHESGIDAHIARRAAHDVKRRKNRTRGTRKIPLGRRWRIERSNSWLSNFGKLRRSTDRKAIHREAHLDLAVTLLITVKLVKWTARYGPVILILT